MCEERKLTAKQLEAIDVIIAHKDWPLSTVADEIGVHFNSIYKWNKQERFREELQRQLKEAFKDSQKLALQTLLDCVKNGDRQAAIYVLDNCGYKLPEKSEVEIGTSDVIRINIG